MSDELDPLYALLDLPPGASLYEVERAHRDLALSWHPDQFAPNDPLRAHAAAKLQAIDEAAELLRAHLRPTVLAKEVASRRQAEAVADEDDYSTVEPFWEPGADANPMAGDYGVTLDDAALRRAGQIAVIAIAVGVVLYMVFASGGGGL